MKSSQMHELTGKILSKIRRYIIPKVRYITDSCSTYLPLICGAVILVYLLANASERSSSVVPEGSSLLAFNIMGTLGVATAFSFLLYSFFYQGMITACLFSMISTFIVMALLGDYSNDFNRMIESIIENPEQSLTATLCLVIMLLIIRFAKPKSRAIDSFLYGRRAMGQTIEKASLTPDSLASSIKLTAVHEAGHALIYALLENRPNDINIFINRNSGQDASLLGYVQSKIAHKNRRTENEIHWLMLLALAGLAAEKEYFGLRSEGSIADMSTWLVMAERYLSNGFGGIYYFSPTSPLQREQNTNSIEKLKERQLIMLGEFMSLNHSILEELAEVLVSCGEMNNEQLSPILDKVTLPERMEAYRLVSA